MFCRTNLIIEYWCLRSVNLKSIFWYSQFLQKTNKEQKKNYPKSSQDSFSLPSVYFLEELSIPNIAFEIYWPLYTIFVIKFNSFNQICWHCALCNCWKLCQHNSLSFSNVCQKHVLLLDGWWSVKWVEINSEGKFIFIFPWNSTIREMGNLGGQKER